MKLIKIGQNFYNVEQIVRITVQNENIVLHFADQSNVRINQPDWAKLIADLTDLTPYLVLEEVKNAVELPSETVKNQELKPEMFRTS